MGTYVLEIDLERKFLPHLAFVSALAIHDTIEKFILDVDGQILQLKWPNDLILNKLKCGGILIENISSNPGLTGFLLLCKFAEPITRHMSLNFMN